MCIIIYTVVNADNREFPQELNSNVTEVFIIYKAIKLTQHSLSHLTLFLSMFSFLVFISLFCLLEFIYLR